jgi:hypothetical protein
MLGITTSHNEHLFNEHLLMGTSTLLTCFTDESLRTEDRTPHFLVLGEPLGYRSSWT